jgi:hypothetical protein
MGRIGEVLSFARVDDDGIVGRVVVDLGGGDKVEADIYGDSGSENPPVAGDYAAVVTDPSTGGWTAVGFLGATGTAGSGERVTWGRDADGVIVSTITQKADGTVRMENDNGYFELKPDGQVDVNGNLTVDP